MVIGLSLILVLSRVLPHIPNFTASIAALIFGAVVLRRFWIFGVLIFAYWISDLIINNTIYVEEEVRWMSKGFLGMIGIYAFIFFLNKQFSSTQQRPLRLLYLSILNSLIFFLLSNFLVWINSVSYSKDIYGIVACYINAIPFLGYECAGSLFYGSLLFGLYWLSPISGRNWNLLHAR